MLELSPDSALHVGSIQIKDTGFSTNCNYDQVMNLALMETNRIGGNGFQITCHREPGVFGSTCHRINGNSITASGGEIPGAPHCKSPGHGGIEQIIERQIG